MALEAWLLFTIVGCLTLYMGYTQPRPGDRLMYYLFSVVFWIASMYMWITDHTGTPEQILILALIAPFLAAFFWGFETLGDYLEQPLKEDPFHD